jgi:hypothetical protein
MSSYSKAKGDDRQFHAINHNLRQDKNKQFKILFYDYELHTFYGS